MAEEESNGGTSPPGWLAQCIAALCVCGLSVPGQRQEAAPITPRCLGPSQRNLDALHPYNYPCPISEPDHPRAGPDMKLASPIRVLLLLRR